MVRVQAGRLRSKLAEYYSSDGIEDPMVVELPKGTYLLSFHQRNSSVAKPAHGNLNGIARTKALEKSSERRWGTEVISLSIFLAAAITVIVWLLATRNSSAGESCQPTRAPARRVPRLLERFYFGAG